MTCARCILNSRSADDLLDVLLLRLADIGAGLHLALSEDLAALARTGLLDLLLELLLGLTLGIALWQDLYVGWMAYLICGDGSWVRT